MTKMKNMMLSMVILGAVLTVVSHDSLVMAQAASTWSFVTIPDLPTGASLARLWTDRPGNLYVWANRLTPAGIPGETFLYRWNGKAWEQVLHLPGRCGFSLFGTGPSGIFASAGSYDIDWHPEMYHYDGTTWTQQQLPVNNGTIPYIKGKHGDIYALTQNNVLHYDGTDWTISFSGSGEAFGLVYIAPNEVYTLRCWGHNLWDGNTWTYYPAGFSFCDLWAGAWGMRDNQGKLHLYTAGCNNFSNGVRVWRFTETYPGSKVGSWGSVFSDGDGQGIGKADGIWGSGPNDIYVSGDLYGTGRVYHFDGTEWKRITDFGDIPPAGPVGGSGADDVWVILADGRLLHYGHLRIILPNGGENWIAGKMQNIQWEISDTNAIPNVHIEYSTNNGQGWNDVNTVPNTGSYNWLVPQVTSNQCLVRISNAADANVFDVSDNTFIIYQCRLNSKADLNGDCKVDFTDLAIFANDWLKCGNPFDPVCTIGDGLVAYWNFNEISGDTVNDSSGNNYNGTIYGAVRTNGVTGNGLLLEGSDYAEFANTNDLHLQSGLTLSAWIKYTDAGDSACALIIGKHQAYYANGYMIGLLAGKIHFYVGGLNGTNLDSTLPYNDGLWHHVAGTHDGIIGRLYVDGNWLGEVNQPYLTTNSTPIRMGLAGGADWTYSPIEIDEVRIYNRALSESEIKYLHDNP